LSFALRIASLALLATASLPTHAVVAVPTTIAVSGSANPWLAGMPDGSSAAAGDTAPNQSPVLVDTVAITPGTTLLFSASGLASYDNTNFFGPRGDFAGTTFGFLTHLALLGMPGEENGIGNVNAPLSSLVGVFLDANQPSLSDAPAMLDFGVGGNVAGGIDYATLSPLLKQVFFIGDGRTSTDLQQGVVVPVGATRLYLGTMDGFGWDGNGGSFDVSVTAVPEPETYALLLAGLGLVGWKLRRTRAATTRSKG
jgi:hypothetical protein